MKLKTMSSLIAVVTALGFSTPANAADHDRDRASTPDMAQKTVRLARDLVIGVPVSAVKGSIGMVALGTSFGAETLVKKKIDKVPALAISGLLLGPGCALFGIVAGSKYGLDQSIEEWQSK